MARILILDIFIHLPSHTHIVLMDQGFMQLTSVNIDESEIEMECFIFPSYFHVFRTV